MARTLLSPRLLPLAAVAAALDISTPATVSSPSWTVRGSDRSETLTGTPGRDVVCGKGGNDRLRGLGGDDVLLGGSGGNDMLDDPMARDCEGGSTPPPAPEADLSVTLTDSVDPLVEGDAVEYCVLGTVASGESVSRVLGVSWSEAGDQTVTATVSGASPTDPAAANNSETETTSVSD